MRSKSTVLLVAAAAIAIVPVSAAWASVTTFTGGDPGEGITLGSPLYAFAPDSPTEVLQGVTFQSTNANITGFPPDGYGASYADSGDETPTANDLSLEPILNNGRYGTSPQVITISGLSAGDSYIINALLADNGSNQTARRTESFYFNGSANASDTVATTSGLGYDVQDTVPAQAGGTITLQLTALTANPYPILSALVVTPVVPEPTALALLALAGAGLLLWPRKKAAR